MGEGTGGGDRIALFTLPLAREIASYLMGWIPSHQGGEILRYSANYKVWSYNNTATTVNWNESLGRLRVASTTKQSDRNVILNLFQNLRDCFAPYQSLAMIWWERYAPTKVIARSLSAEFILSEVEGLTINSMTKQSQDKIPRFAS
jgi:hypothetical protein